MLSLRILNSSATLNSFYDIGSLEFLPGSPATLVVQLFQTQDPNELRYIPAIGSTLVITLLQNDNTTIDVPLTVFVDDRSIWSVELTGAQTENLSGGNFTFTLDEGSGAVNGLVELGLSRLNTGSC